MANDIALPLHIVLDSNVLISEHLLTTFVGASLMDQITRRSGKIVISDIVKREVLAKLRSDNASNLDQIAKIYANFGKYLQKVISLPAVSETELSKGMEKILEGMQAVIVSESFTLEKANKALDRIFAKRAPCSSNNEQFRDACIWQDCVDRSETGTLLFISNDNAFYDKNTKEPHPDIKEEIKRLGASIFLFRTLVEAVSFISPDAPTRDLASAKKDLLQRLNEITEKDLHFHFSLQKNLNVDVKLKLTNEPAVALLQFDTLFLVKDRTLWSASRINNMAKLSGSAKFNVTTNVLSGVIIDNATYTYTENGEDLESQLRLHRSHLIVR